MVGGSPYYRVVNPLIEFPEVDRISRMRLMDEWISAVAGNAVNPGSVAAGRGVMDRMLAELNSRTIHVQAAAMLLV